LRGQPRPRAETGCIGRGRPGSSSPPRGSRARDAPPQTYGTPTSALGANLADKAAAASSGATRRGASGAPAPDVLAGCLRRPAARAARVLGQQWLESGARSARPSLLATFAPQASAARARAWPNPWQPCAAGFRVPNRGLRRPKACAAEHALGCRRPHPGAAQSAGEPLATLRRRLPRPTESAPQGLRGRTTLAGHRAPADLALRCSTARLIFACVDMCAYAVRFGLAWPMLPRK